MKNEIDYALRSKKLDEVLFDVELQNIYSEFRRPGTVTNQLITTKRHHAIVNQSNGEIISVAGNNYMLISNQKAITMGKQIFAQLFPQVETCDLIPYKIVVPKSKASVHIDLIHKDINFSVCEGEIWLPFLRITNSYNRSYALSFEVGFVRKLCSNGLLLNKEIMKLKYHHNMNNRMNIQNDAAKIKSVSTIFIEQCNLLKNYGFYPELIVPLVFQVLNINLELPKAPQIMKKVTYLKDFIELIKVLSTRYFNELGCNAYAAFNVITDLVSHQDEYKNLPGYYLSVRSYYSKPSGWMDDFSKRISYIDFEFPEYLKKTIDSLEGIKEQTKLEWELN